MKNFTGFYTEVTLVVLVFTDCPALGDWGTSHYLSGVTLFSYLKYVFIFYPIFKSPELTLVSSIPNWKWIPLTAWNTHSPKTLQKVPQYWILGLPYSD